MKLRNYIATGSLFALLALTGGCSSEELIDNGTGTEVPGANTQELVFNFGGLRLPSPGTRAETIATKDETIVDNLVIILAGVDDETHTSALASIVYEYRSQWATPPVETDKYKKLDLVQNGNVLTGKLLVDEAVMLPKLVQKKALVLVNGVKVRLTTVAGGAVRDFNTAQALSQLVATEAYQMCGGTVTGADLAAAGVDMELLWGPADLETEDIECPLPMSARIEQINFHGSTNLDVQLKRHVSRFDVRNGQNTTLRIGSMRPLKATTGIEFDEATGTRVDMQDQSFLPALPDADWANVPAEVVPAFYTFPSSLVQTDQLMKFRVTAKKLNGTSGLWEDKTYTLNLENADRQSVSIDANTRYVINIMEVTDLHITASITIADWQQGGDIDGDLKPVTASKKTPVLNSIADDAANSIAWTTDPSGAPTALSFGKAFTGQTITFVTPQEMAIDPADPDADQPKVSIDIFKEEGENNAGAIWLQASEVVTTRAIGDIEHTLTVGAVTDGKYPVLYVKVKNYYYPEQYIMFRVTAVASDKTPVDMEGDPNPIDPDGWTQDPDADEFDEGTVDPTLYEGQASVLLALPGKTAYYVAPKNALSGVAWTSVDFATCCPAGWHVPTMAEMEAMTGTTYNAPDYSNDYATISAAFPQGAYWSPEEADVSKGKSLSIMDGAIQLTSDNKTSSFNVRCVRKK